MGTMIIPEIYVYIVLIAVIAVVFLLDARTLAFYCCAIVRVLGGQHVSVFNISSISILKLTIDDFEVSIPAVGDAPQMSCSFKKVEATVHLSHLIDVLWNKLPFTTRRSLQGGDSLPLFSILVLDLVVGSSQVTMKDFMMPGKNSKARKPYRIDKGWQLISLVLFALNNTMRWIEVEMRDMSFDFAMPSEDVAMQGSAESIVMRFQQSKSLPSESILMQMVVRDGIMEINEHNERAMLYAGHITRVLVDYHLPTGMMDVLGNLYGTEHDMEVCIPRFMNFFNKFQEADDFAAGIKIGRGMEPSGKMSMCVEIERLKVGVTDPRIPGQSHLIVLVERCRASLSTFKLTVEKQRTHKGRLCLAETGTPCNRIFGSENFLPPLLMDAIDVLPTTPSTTPSKRRSQRRSLKSFKDFLFRRSNTSSSLSTSARQSGKGEEARTGLGNDFNLSPNAEKEMTMVCGKVLFQLSSLSDQFYVEDVEFVKVVTVNNERDFVDNDSTEISMRNLHMLGLDQAMIDWLVLLQDTSNRLPSSVHSHPRNSKMAFSGRSMSLSMCPVAFTASIPDLRHKHDNNVTYLPTIPLDDERLIAFVFHDVEVHKTASVREPNLSRYTIGIALQEIRTCQPLSDFQAQHQVLLLDGVEGGTEFSIQGGQFLEDNGRRASFKESVERSRSTQHTPHARYNHSTYQRGQVPHAFCSEDGRQWRRPGTGSLWKFYGLHCAMQMGARTVFESMSMKKFDIDFINSCRPRRPPPKSTRHSDSSKPPKASSSQKKPAATSTSTTAPRAKPRPNAAAPFREELSQHEFVSIVGMHAVWRNPNDVRAKLKSTHVHASVAGMLKFNCAFKMIKTTMDTMFLRMERARLLGDHVLDHKALGRMRQPDENEIFAYEVRIEDLTVVLSASLDPLPTDASGQVSASGKDDDSSANFSGNANSQQNSAPFFHGITGLSSDELGRCMIVKCGNFVFGQYGATVGQRVHFDHCEVSLSNYPSMPFMSIAQFDHITKKKPHPDDAHAKGLVKRRRRRQLIGSQQCRLISDIHVKVRSIVLQMHSEMAVGLLADSLLQQDALYKAAMMPKTDKKNPYLIYDSFDMFDAGDDGAAVLSDSVPSGEQSASPNIASGILSAALSSDDLYRMGRSDDAGFASRHQLLQPPAFLASHIQQHCSRNAKAVLQAQSADLYADVYPDNQSDALSPEFNPMTSTAGAGQTQVAGSSTDAQSEAFMFSLQMDSFVIKVEVPLPSESRGRSSLGGRASQGDDSDECILTIEFTKVDHTVMQLQDNDTVQDDILRLDIGSEALSDEAAFSPTQFYIYQGIQGGDMHSRARSMRVALSVQRESLMEVSKPSMAGLCYLASIKDERVPVEYQISQCLDSMRIFMAQPQQQTRSSRTQSASGRAAPRPQSSADSLADDDESVALATPLQAVPEDVVPIYAVITRSLAPSKIYGDVEMRGTVVEVTLRKDTSHVLDAVGPALERCAPPNKDISPPLAFWDSLRYWLHGSLALQMDTVKVNYHLPNVLSESMTLAYSMHHPQLHLDREAFEFTMIDAEVWVSLISQMFNSSHVVSAPLNGASASRGAAARSSDMITMRKSNRFRGRRTGAFTGSTGTSGGGQSSKNKQMKTRRSRLCHIPGFVMALRYSMFSSAVTPSAARTSVEDFCHHHVYLKPAIVRRVEEPESVGIGAGADALNTSHDILGKVRYLFDGVYYDDLLYRQSDRFVQFRLPPFSVKWDLEMRFAHRDKDVIAFNLRLDVLLRVYGAFFQPGNKDQPKPADAAAQKKPAGLPMLSLCTQMDIQFVMDETMLMSLLSDTLLKGIVMKHQIMDIQLRLTRKSTSHRSSAAQRKQASAVSFDTGVQSKVEAGDAADASISVEQLLQSHPLQVDHLFMELYMAELYVDAWDRLSWDSYFDIRQQMSERHRRSTASARTTTGANNTGTSHVPFSVHTGTPSARSSTHADFDDDIQSISSTSPPEPRSPHDFAAMMKPLCKFAHASRIVVSLTESGEVSNRSTTFQSTGILNKTETQSPPDSATATGRADSVGSPRGWTSPRSALSTASGKFSSVRTSSSESANTPRATDSHNRKSRAAANSKSPSRTSSTLNKAPQAPRQSSQFVIGKEWRRRTVGAVSVSENVLDKLRAFRHSNSPPPSVPAAAVAGGKASPQKAASSGGVKMADVVLRAMQQQKEARGEVARRPTVRAPEGGPGNRSRSKSPMARDMPARRISILDPKRLLQQQSVRSVVVQKPDEPAVEKWQPGWGYRALLRSFTANHAAFTPPQNALPKSYEGPRSVRIGGPGGALSGIGTPAGMPMSTRHVYVGTAQHHQNQSSFGNKIWGLRVIDGRILFTIDMRDVLFEYVARTMEIFWSSEDEDVVSPHDEGDTDSLDLHMLTHDHATTNAPLSGRERASLSDFILLDDSQGTGPSALSPMNSVQHHRSSVRGFFNTHPSQQLNHAADSLNLPDPQAMATRDRIVSDEMSQQSGWMMDAQHAQTSTHLHPALFNLSPMNTSEAGLLGAFDSADGNGDLAASFTSPQTQAAPPPNSRTKRMKETRRGSLLNRSIEMPEAPAGRDRLATDADSPRTPGAQASSAKRKSTASANDPRKPVNEYFFVVEFIDPQLNFLDTDTHSSLIIVAGRAMVEGKRLNTAILPALPFDGGVQGAAAPALDSDAHVVAKRRQEIRLRMDGVSAYTVPSMLTEVAGAADPFTASQSGHGATNSASGEDEVHWKLMQSTADKMEVKSTVASGGNATTTCKDNTARLMVNMHGMKQTHGMTESPYMKVAIRDFQIRALYIFWTDVTADEAKELFVQRRDEDLTYTFRLELPDLVVDITSWQFYIFLHVVKNVLLVPPPTTTLSKRQQDAAEEAEGSKFVSIARDAATLAKYNFKSAGGALDINNQRSRDELRILIEDFITNNQSTHSSSGYYSNAASGATARFMEVFIGRMSWILRTSGLNATSAASSSDKELIEAGFIGIYASINFHENRSLNSSFEIQRLWMLNRHPGDDTAGFADRTCVMVPELRDQEVCTRCNQSFSLDNNPSTACIFHADDDGNPGQYCEIIYLDELSKKEIRQMGWTCCHKHHRDAAGCSARPHMGKEVMVSIRVDAHPRVRFGDDVDVSVIQGIEISIFPGANYDLRLQITKSLADILHKYFSIESGVDAAALAAYSSAQAERAKDVGNPDSAEIVTISTHAPQPSAKDKKPGLLRQFNIFKRGSNSSTGTTKKEKSTAAATAHGSAAVTPKTPRDRTGSTASVSDSHHAGERSSVRLSSSAGTAAANNSDSAQQVVRVSSKNKKKRQEALYLRRLRVGEIFVDVSTAGFTINLDRFKAEMEPFICRGEVLDWRRLIWNFERHLVWSLTKHTASNSLTRIGEFFGRKKTAAVPAPTGAALLASPSQPSLAEIQKRLQLGLRPTGVSHTMPSTPQQSSAPSAVLLPPALRMSPPSSPRTSTLLQTPPQSPTGSVSGIPALTTNSLPTGSAVSRLFGPEVQTPRDSTDGIQQNGEHGSNNATALAELQHQQHLLEEQQRQLILQQQQLQVAQETAFKAAMLLGSHHVHAHRLRQHYLSSPPGGAASSLSTPPTVIVGHNSSASSVNSDLTASVGGMSTGSASTTQAGPRKKIFGLF